MNVEIRIEAVQFPEKEYINGIFLEVWVGMRYNSPAAHRFSTIVSRERFNKDLLLGLLLLVSYAFGKVFRLGFESRSGVIS